MRIKKLFLFQLILFAIAFSTPELVKSAPKSVSLTNAACKYDVTIPEGWDTIPQAILKEKITQYSIDSGIYPIDQEDYFKGNYVLFVFTPSLKSLSSFSFNEIVQEIAAQNEHSEIENDTLKVTLVNFYPEIKDSTYSIHSHFQIRHNADLLRNAQMLRLTKFGYVSVLAYTTPAGLLLPDEIVTLLSDAISVQPDYIYSEPEKRGLNRTHILISLAVGILVYVLIAGFSKLKKKG